MICNRIVADENVSLNSSSYDRSYVLGARRFLGLEVDLWRSWALGIKKTGKDASFNSKPFSTKNGRKTTVRNRSFNHCKNFHSTTDLTGVSVRTATFGYLYTWVRAAMARRYMTWLTSNNSSKLRTRVNPQNFLTSLKTTAKVEILELDTFNSLSKKIHQAHYPSRKFWSAKKLLVVQQKLEWNINLLR